MLFSKFLSPFLLYPATVSARPGQEKFTLLWVLGIVTLWEWLSKSFLSDGRISFSHAYTKNKGREAIPYLLNSH